MDSLGIKENGMKLIVIIGIVFLSISCSDLLDKQPKNELSTATFWESASDAEIGLAGVYSYTGNRSWRGVAGPLNLDVITDNGIRTNFVASMGLFSDQLTPSDPTVTTFWNNSYEQIAKCNNFLENIGNADMDEEEKKEMIAEVRFLRAYVYYNLSQYWGSVPLVAKTLTMEEANTVSRVSKEEVVNFVLSELTEAANILPETRPGNEHGRIIKSAALAVKGRLLLAQKRWSEAASVYKQIIDSGVHSIDPDYKALFDGTKEESPEIIFSSKFVENTISNDLQLRVKPNIYGGFHQYNPYQNLIDTYLCTDGKSVDKSPLYNADFPYNNRDPRLHHNFFLPGRTMFAGEVYQGHPDSTTSGDQAGSSEDPENTGYGLKKYADEDYTGDIYAGGTDIPIIRYAEVLLSYLEAKIKAGDPIDQALLDQTVNKVRSRASVSMPSVTETNTNRLWEILKRERRVEFPFEGLRYWDLLRWNELDTALNRTFYGMKITDNPANYSGVLAISDEGYYEVFTLTFDGNKDYQWPIPQDEMDINPNLEQYPEYQ